jgi:TRAP-type C4-dicarboxylate transport system substrate-binding protein
MRRHGVALIICFITMLLFLGITLMPLESKAATKGPIVIRLVQPAPAGDFPLAYKDMELAKRFNARTKDYKIEVFAGGGLVKVPETIDAVRIGAVEMACIDWGIFSFLDPRLGAEGIVFLSDSEEANIAMAKPMVPLFDAVFQEKFNQKALGRYSTGLMGVYSNKPIKSLEDMKGLLVGSGSPPTSDMLKSLGASPVYVNWTDLYESLNKHVIDATMQTGHGAVAMQIVDTTKYVVPFFGHGCWNGYTINLDIWKKMPKDVQKILQEEVDAACEWMGTTELKLFYEDDPKIVKKKGLTTYVLTKAERDRWKAQTAALQEKQIANLGEFGRKIKAIADEANKKYPYDEKKMKAVQ